MGNIVCIHCGAEAHSKCPYCRNIFPDNQSGFGLEARQGTEPTGKKNGLDELQIVQSWRLPDEPIDTPALNERVREFHAFIASLTADEFVKLTCRHQWVFKPGQSSSIGCGHGSSEVPA